jgi:hypothetical protein
MTSCSIYIKANAITNPGNTKPINGTRIDGRYAAVIIFYYKIIYVILQKINN